MKRSNWVGKKCIWVSLLCMLLLLTACPVSQTRKSVVVEPEYVMSTDTLPFSFFMPQEAILQMAEIPQKEKVFVDLIFPQEKARLYCTYYAITPERFRVMAEESRKLVYFHSAKADAIHEDFYEDPGKGVYGIFYTLDGKVATPFQLSLTDSATYYFHASLYFDSGESRPEKVDTLKILAKDLKQLMETFKHHPVHSKSL